MEEIKCKKVGQITAQGYTEMTGRVYGQEGISPTINTCCGGHHEPKVLEKNYRVRKLTEQECFKLQGVKIKDFENIRKNQSKSSCYHLAGDSITTTVLMAIFGEMCGVDYKTKINELVEELTNER